MVSQKVDSRTFLEREQVRKGGLPPPLGERGQATLSDLFTLGRVYDYGFCISKGQYPENSAVLSDHCFKVSHSYVPFSIFPTQRFPRNRPEQRTKSLTWHTV